MYTIVCMCVPGLHGPKGPYGPDTRLAPACRGPHGHHTPNRLYGRSGFKEHALAVWSFLPLIISTPPDTVPGVMSSCLGLQ